MSHTSLFDWFGKDHFDALQLKLLSSKRPSLLGFMPDKELAVSCRVDSIRGSTEKTLIVFHLLQPFLQLTHRLTITTAAAAASAPARPSASHPGSRTACHRRGRRPQRRQRRPASRRPSRSSTSTPRTRPSCRSRKATQSC